MKLTKRRMLSNYMYILKHVFSLAPFYYIFYITMVSVVSAIDSVLFILLFKYMVESVSDHIAFVNIAKVLLTYGGFLGSITIIINIILTHVNEVVTVRVSEKIQQQIIDKSAKIELIYYDKAEFYDGFIRAVERGESQIKNSINILTTIIAGFSSIVSVVLVISSIDLVIAVIPFVACFINLFIKIQLNLIKYKMVLELEVVKRRKNYASRIFYQPEYAKEVRMTDISESIIDLFDSAVCDEKRINKIYGKKLMALNIINYLLSWTFMVYYIPFFYMIYQTTVTKKMKISELISMNEANTTLVNSLTNLTQTFSDLQEVGQFGEQYRMFMEINCNLEERRGDNVSQNQVGILEIKNLSFKYSENSPYVLKNINMVVHPQEKIAIVGYNGAGKTTLIKLLLNLYDYSEGQILYKEKEIKNYDIKSYRSIFGTVFQNFQVYATTVAQNIMMNNVTEKDENIVKKALEIVGLDKKVESMENKLQTQMTREFYSNGTVFSGGENQKLACSRLYAKDFSIAILDEPSSSLDPISEYELNKSMFENMKDKSIILISHRLSTTQMADKIYMFDHGSIVEEGTHDELMQRNEKYAHMFHVQATYYNNI